MQLKYIFNYIGKKLGIGLILIFIVSIHIFIIIGNSFFVEYSILEIKNDAMLINKSGMIRGGIQRVIKLELDNEDTTEYAATIDSIFNEFLMEEKYRLVNEKMIIFVSKLEVLRREWDILKELILTYRATKQSIDKSSLLAQSEYIWSISEDALSTISILSSQKTNMFKNIYFIFLIDFFLIVFIIYLINKKIRNKLEILSTTDPLTNIKNRNMYNEALCFELELNKRAKYNTAFLFIDIDSFKEINDTYGHDAGDLVLKELVLILEETIRKTDMIFRIGGEEFVIFVKEIKKENLEKLANEIRLHVENFDSKISHKFTISIGATMFNPNDTKDTIFKRVDEALYKSKGSGRNKVTVV
jgi:diguanylate cyclase (GGDEF)-like protein